MSWGGPIGGIEGDQEGNEGRGGRGTGTQGHRGTGAQGQSEGSAKLRFAICNLKSAVRPVILRSITHKFGNAMQARGAQFVAMDRLRVADTSVAERPRERLLTLGPSALTAVELLAILLGTGTARADALSVAAPPRVRRRYGLAVGTPASEFAGQRSRRRSGQGRPYRGGAGTGAAAGSGASRPRRGHPISV